MGGYIDFYIKDLRTNEVIEYSVSDGTTLAVCGLPPSIIDALMVAGYNLNMPIDDGEWFTINASINTPHTTKGNFDMSKPVIEQKTLFRGVDVATMSDTTLLDTLRAVEGEIESLRAIKTESSAIAKQIDKLNGALIVIVKALDAKAA